MTLATPAELKKKLRAEGFEIYRAQPAQIQLAERIRDNLIMDSGVTVEIAEDSAELAVGVTIRAQASHFPGMDESDLTNEAEKLSLTFAEAGYTVMGSRTTPVPDPSDPSRTLDISYEIQLRRVVSDLSGLFYELKLALGRQRHSSDD